MAVLNVEMAVAILPNPKKKAKFNRRSVKHILDETAIEIVKSNGYVEDRRPDDFCKLLEGTTFTAIALYAQFYFEKFPVKILKKNQLVLCYILYIRGIPQLVGYLMVRLRHVFLFTYPAAKSRCSTGLALSSKLPRSSDLYTLTIASAEPGSSWAKPPVKLTKSFTEWFASDGVLMEDHFSKDVEGLLNDYAKESNESKWGMWDFLSWCLIPGFLRMFFYGGFVETSCCNDSLSLLAARFV